MAKVTFSPAWAMIAGAATPVAAVANRSVTCRRVSFPDIIGSSSATGLPARGLGFRRRPARGADLHPRGGFHRPDHRRHVVAVGARGLGLLIEPEHLGAET